MITSHQPLISSRLVVAALGAMLTACSGGPSAGPAHAHAALPSASPSERRVLDDFRTGLDSLTVTGTGLRQRGQGGSMLGNSRCIVLSVTGNAYDRPATVEVRADPLGYLAVDTGAGVDHSLSLLYGYDDRCEGRPLDEDLSHFDALELQLAALDLDTAGAIAVWSASGTAAAPLDIAAGSASKTVRFDAFQGSVDWAHVHHLVVELQSGGALGAHDYLLRSLSAVTVNDTP